MRHTTVHPGIVLYAFACVVLVIGIVIGLRDGVKDPDERCIDNAKLLLVVAVVISLMSFAYTISMH